MRLLVVMNPSAHDFEARRRWPKLEKVLQGSADVTLLETDPDDAKTLAAIREKLATDAFTRVLAIGGDGTIHLVVNAIATSTARTQPEFAVIPFGTANNVSKSLELPAQDLRMLARIAVGEELVGLDFATVTATVAGKTVERIWVNCLGVGMDADVVFARRNYRDLGGYLGYAAALAERSVEQRSMDVTAVVDGVSVNDHAFNLIITNTPIYAGTLSLPGARHDDGLLDLYLFDRLEYGSKVLSFAIKQADFLKLGVSEMLEGVTENQRAFHARHVKVELDSERRLQIDGEALGAVRSFECRVIGRLRVAARGA
jgi:diacylglycerol kinase (ATP)